jgi:hypothetical protein
MSKKYKLSHICIKFARTTYKLDLYVDKEYSWFGLPIYEPVEAFCVRWENSVDVK